MLINELQPGPANGEITAIVSEKSSIREFDKFGKKGRVCNAILEDGSGSITLTLWNDEIESLNVGDKVKLSNGWVSEFRGEKQISTGKFGQIEILEKGIPKPQPVKEEPLPAEEDVEFIKEEEKVG